MFLSAMPNVSVNRQRFRGAARSWLPFVMGLLLVAAFGCYNNNTGEANIGEAIKLKLPAFPETGSNAVQVFTEMHYQPSYRSQEAPRLLPPEGSVPITGAEITYTSLDDYNASPPVGGNPSLGQALYEINCFVCHGSVLDGNGPIVSFNYAGVFPANLMLDPTRQSTDNEIYAFISGGGRQGLALRLRGRKSQSPMPEFRRMLTEQERWDLVAYLRAAIGQP